MTCVLRAPIFVILLRAVAVALVLGTTSAAFAAAPTAATTAATSVMSTSALLNGSGNPNGEMTTGWFRINTTNPGTCNDVFGTRIPAMSGTSLGAGAGSMSYAISAVSLTPGTTYYFCAITSNPSGNGFGSVLSFTTPGPPAVVTTGATSIASSTAVLNGTANPTAATSTGWFRLHTTDPGTCSDSAGTRVPASGTFSLGIGTTPVAYSFNTNTAIGLTPGTTYWYCALANNSLGTSVGAVVSFTTLPVAPTVSTTAATALTATTATLNANVNPGGGSTTGWFRYSAVNPGSCSDTFGTRVPTGGGGTDLGSSNTSQALALPISGLTMGTTYYFCAIASNTAGNTIGNLLTFTTPTAPSATTNAPQAINDTSATLSGTVNPNGAATTGWFRYATSSPGTCNDSFGTRVPATGAQDLGSSYSAGTFTLSATSLAPTTTYFTCVIANNSLGTAFGSVVQFTTRDRPTVTTSAPSSVTSNSAVLAGTGNPNGATASGWFRIFTTDPGTCTDTGGLARIPTSGGQNLGSGTTIASYSFNTNTVTALLPGTLYYYCALASNTFGTSVGNVVQFTTQPALPSVSTVSATALTASTATLNGSANPGGGATTGWFRYSTTNPGSCTDAFGTRAPAVMGGSTLGSGLTGVPYTQPITGLTQGTLYYYCAIASNAAGTGFGGVGTFTTPTAPTVTTNAVTSIANITATLNGTANPNGDAAIGWFRLGTMNPGTCDDSFGSRVPTVGNVTLGSSGSVPYSQPASGLLPNTTYYVCAVAQNALGTSFGAVQSFTTFDKPSSTTSAASAITSTTAQLNGAGNPNGSQTTAWFRLYTSDPGACNDTTGTRVHFSSSANLGFGRTSVGYLFNTNTTIALLPGTTYWYCAVANNVYGTSLGNLVTFTTPPVQPTVQTNGATAVTSTTATINGSAVPGGATTTAWFRYSPTNPGGCSDTFGTRVPAMMGGTDIGAGNTSIPFSQALTGLTPGTVYYFCALASNSVGTVFGNLTSFTTTSPPSVTTNAASGVGDTTVTLVGTANPNGDAATGWFRYSTTNPTTCDDMFGTRVPASSGTSLGSSTSLQGFSQPVNGLTPNTTYYYCAIAQNSLGTSFGAVVSFTTRAPAAVTTLAATALTTTTAQLNGTGNPNGASTTGWFRLYTSDPGTCGESNGGNRVHPFNSFTLGTGSSPVPYNYNTNTALALTPGTTYWYCAVATNSFGTSFGALVTFTTPAAPPAVTTGSASPVTDMTATLNATANPGGGSTIGWFRYSSISPGVCSDTFGARVPAATGGTSLGASNTPQAFSQMISGLTQGTIYYFCAIASNSAGTTFGSLNNFTTPTAPSVTTSPASGINDNNVTLVGAANPNRDATTGWFRYSTTNPVTCDDNFGTRVPAAGGTNLGAGSSSTGFTQPVTGLTPTTTYYYCAIAQNSLGTAFGSVVQFTTKNKPTVTTSPATVLTSSTAQLNGSVNPNGASTSAWFRLYTTDPGACTDAAGNRVSPSTSFNAGTGTAALPYNFNTNTAIGLTPGTTYWFCAIANNTYGTSLGPVVTLTTPPAVPSVSTGSANPIMATGATLNATATPNGGSTTAWFRYSATSPGSCNDTFGSRVPAVMGGSDLGSSNTAQPFSQAITDLAQGTTYYFCAIASNSAGTAVGTLNNFTTLTSPTVTTNAATSVSNLSAQLNGTADPNGDTAIGWFRLGTANPVTCDDTFGNRVPTVGSVSLGNTTNPQAYAQPASGLTPNTTYWVCAVAQNSLGKSYGLPVSFTTFDKPAVTTSPATSVATTTAQLNGSGNPIGAATTAWFRLYTADPGACDDLTGTRVPINGTSQSLGSARSPVSYNYNTNTAISLSPGTTYWYCAVANNAYGTSFGALVTFTTPAVLPTVTTSPATNLTSTTATINGSANPGGATTTGWFRYSNTNPGLCSDTFGTRIPATGGADLGAGNTPVPFSQALTGLSPNVTYYFCAIASNSQGVAYGTLRQFTAPATPTVTTLAATPVTSMTATLNGQANPNGNATIGWFRYATANPGLCNDAFGTRVPGTTGTGTNLGTATTPQPYAQALTSLAPGMTYYFCAIANNSQGTSFGSVLSFTTPVSDQAPGVSTVAATSITGTGATLNGSANPNGAPATGWFRYAATSPGSCNDTFGTRVPTSGGSPLGSGNSPIDYAQPVAGLTPGTTYFFCAIAQNGAGTSVGSVLSVTTPVAPNVTTDPASNIGTTTATLNGSANPRGSATNGWFRYDTTDPGSCNDGFGTRIPASGGSMLGAGTTDVNFAQALTSLSANTTYYYCAIAQNGAGISFGAVRSFVTPVPPTVVTVDATGVASTTATINGTANPNGDTTTGWFRFDTTNPGSCTDSFGTRVPGSGGSALGAGSTAAPYAQMLMGLVPSTTYYFCAIASNSVGTSFGGVLSFTTPAAPIVTTTPATAISATSAALNGSANPRMATAIGFFRYATTSPGTCNDTFGARVPTSGGTSLGFGIADVAFTETLNGLTPGTTYYFCALAANSEGTGLGAVMSFTTPSAPGVTTLPATGVTSTTATFYGSANPDGDSTTGYFRYGTTNPGTCSDTFGTRSPTSGGSSLGGGSSPITFSQAETNLTPGTTYYFCAAAQNSVGTAFGSVGSFVTLALPTVTTLAASGVGSTGATLNGQAVPNGSAATGWFRYGTTDPGTCDDLYGTRVPAANGTSLGSGTTAAPFSQALTNLTPGTTYYFCAIAENAVGATAGTALTFATSPIGPTVTTSSVSGVTLSGATLNGSAIPNGAATTGWFRYGTSNPGTCNDTFGTRVPAGSGGSPLGAGSTAASFSQEATGLSAGVTYYFCAIGSNSAGTAFGAVVSFRIDAPAPIVMTEAATAITATGATLNGSANPNGTAATGWYRYDTTMPAACNDSFGTRAPATGGTDLGSGAAAMSFTTALTNLEPNLTYYTCAIASNQGGAAFGTIMMFTTATAAPAVRTLTAGTEMDGHKTLSGAANPHGLTGAAWFQYGMTNPGTCTSTFGTRVPSTDIMLSAVHTDVMIETTLGDLAPGAYYYCAAASNSVGTTYGLPVRFDVAMPPSPDGGAPDGGGIDGGGTDGGAGGTGGAGGRGGTGGAGGSGGTGTGGTAGTGTGGAGGTAGGGGAGGAAGRGGTGGGAGGRGGTTGGAPGDGGVVDGGGKDANQTTATDKGCGCGLASGSPGLGGIAALLVAVGFTIRRRRRT